MTTSVQIEGLERLERGLDTLQAARFRQRLEFVVAQLLRAAIAQYPPPPKYPLRWASPRQRFWFLRAVKEGRIEVPYRRQYSPTSQRLGPSWTVATEGGQTFVGTRVTYAPYVQSAAHQQPFHADTGWKTDEQAAREVAESRDIQDAAKSLLDKLLEGAR